MRVYKISAVTLSVKNMERSCKFYSNIPGFKVAYGGSYSDFFTTFEICEESTYKMYLNLEVKSDVDSTILKILSYIRPGWVPALICDANRKKKVRNSRISSTILLLLRWPMFYMIMLCQFSSSLEFLVTHIAFEFFPIKRIEFHTMNISVSGI